MSGPDSRQRQKLLVVRLSALGDVVHTIPAVMGLRDHFDVAWAVERPYAELVEIVAGVRALPVSLKRWSWSPIRAARRQVTGFPSAVDFQGLIKSSLLARASGARRRYGFAPGQVRERAAAWFTNRHVAVDPATHVVDWNVALACAVAESDSLPFSAPSDRMVREAFSRFAADHFSMSGAIVLLPGAGKSGKIWPADRFAEVAREFGDRVLAVWGPGEEQLARAIGCRVAPPTSLRELASMLRDAAVVVGGDTGPLHLAAALGTPVVGLFGPTDPRRNGPYGQIDRVVTGSGRTMDSIEASRVIEAVRQAVASAE